MIIPDKMVIYTCCFGPQATVCLPIGDASMLPRLPDLAASLASNFPLLCPAFIFSSNSAVCGSFRSTPIDLASSIIFTEGLRKSKSLTETLVSVTAIRLCSNCCFSFSKPRSSYSCTSCLPRMISRCFESILSTSVHFYVPLSVHAVLEHQKFLLGQKDL